MVWEEVKKMCPPSWLIIEALEARTEGEDRIIEQLAVVDIFEEETSANALLKYLKLHKIHPWREFYVVHSLRPELDIKEKQPLSLRTEVPLIERNDINGKLCDFLETLNERAEKMPISMEEITKETSPSPEPYPSSLFSLHPHLIHIHLPVVNRKLKPVHIRRGI